MGGENSIVVVGDRSSAVGRKDASLTIGVVDIDGDRPVTTVNLVS